MSELVKDLVRKGLGIVAEFIGQMGWKGLEEELELVGEAVQISLIPQVQRLQQETGPG